MTLASDCLTTYTDLQKSKKWKYILYALNDAQTQVTVVKKSKDADWDHFLADLPANQCRWAVHEIVYAVSGVQKSKILFINWYILRTHLSVGHSLISELSRTPSECRTRQLMTYASAKDTLRRGLVGIDVDIQATDKDEVSLATGMMCDFYDQYVMKLTLPAAVLHKVTARTRRHFNDF